MKPGMLCRLTLITLLIFLCSIAFAGTAIKINSASVDLSAEMLVLNGINFDAFGIVTVTVGNTLLQNCTIAPTMIECSLTGTPVITAGEVSWSVSISAGNAPHLNDDIDIFVKLEQTNQGCLPGSFVECYSGDPATRNVGECQTGFCTCLSDGTWSSCEGEITPAIDETCGDLLDTDCDGQISNGCDDCFVDSDCTGDPQPAICNDSSNCQGFRTEFQCLFDSQLSYNTCQEVNIDDDSACGPAIQINCGLYSPIYCSGNPDQSPPTCPSSCFSDFDCLNNAFCNSANQCEVKKPAGASCTANNECISGSCVGDVCAF